MSSSSLPRTIALIALAIVAALTAIVSPASAAPRTTPYRLPADFALPNDLVAGPDGGDVGHRLEPRPDLEDRLQRQDPLVRPRPAARGHHQRYGSLWVADAER